MPDESGTFYASERRPRLLLFPASLRRDSHQRRLIDYMAALLDGCCEIDILQAGEVGLPLYNQDLEDSESIRAEIVAVHDRFGAADGIVVASPEYNSHVSPYLKNTLDWISRLARIDERFAAVNPFAEKPLLLSCASTGWTGGIVGLSDVRAIFAYLGCLVVTDQICISDADHWCRDGAFAFDPGFAGHIERVLATFLSLVVRLRATSTDESRAYA